MRPTRIGLFTALLTVTTLLAAPVTAATATPMPDLRANARAAESREPLARMVDVRVADFAAEAETLPPELHQALQRDVGMTGAEWLAQAEAGSIAVDVVDALRDHVDVRAARLDGLELVVTVGTAAEAAVVESVGARAEIGPRPERTSDTEGLSPAADLRGGMPYFFPDSGGTYRCSIGLVGLDVVTADTQMMSAGHCEGDPGSLRDARNITFPTISGGSVGSSVGVLGTAGFHITHSYPNPDFPGETTYYDLGITTVTGPGWVARPEVVTWGGSSSGAPLSSAPLVIRDAGPAFVGESLCKSGSTTGWTCGLVTRADALEYIGDGPGTCVTPAAGDYCVGAVEADICVRGGDSGGVAVVGTRAVGIVSAATNARVGTCGVAGNIGVFSTLYSAEPQLEQVTKVFPDWEPLIGLASPAFATNGAVRVVGTVGGALPGAGTRHDVTLELDAGEPFTTEVGAGGDWSLNLSAVQRGTRTYSLTSRWGAGVQQSAPTVGRFLAADTTRLAGADRYATSVLIAKQQFPDAGVPVVYLANGADFPDALSAGPAAALEGGPLLLTPATTLPAAVAAELDRLNPTEIVIVGGPGVVSAQVQAAASVYASGDVTRIGGENRYETSRMIADRMLDRGLATRSNLWVATGRDFPDALSAGAAAASQGAPILLVNGTASTIDPDTAAIINNRLRSDRVYIAGGTGVVSEGVRTAIAALASTGIVTREGGVDRFATSWQINTAAFPGSAPEVFLAYGFNFPDALSGSVVAGLRGGPLYITRTACVSSQSAEHVLDLSPTRVTVFGGTAIVSNAARDLTSC